MNSFLKFNYCLRHRRPPTRLLPHYRFRMPTAQPKVMSEMPSVRLLATLAITLQRLRLKRLLCQHLPLV